MNENQFDGKGDIYDKYRPDYPQEFINYIFTNLGADNESVFADIGSGTGKLTKQILGNANFVYAVEPNDDMRKISENRLCKYPNFFSINGSAENTTLADNSIDFITVAQAFHWFNRQSFKNECHRILKEPGRVIIVWNSYDIESELVLEIDAVNKKYCPNFNGRSNGSYKNIDKDDFSDFFNGEYEIKRFNNPLIFDGQGFIGRSLSSSYALKENDENYVKYVEQLKSLFYKYSADGFITIPNTVKSYAGKI